MVQRFFFFLTHLIGLSHLFVRRLTIYRFYEWTVEGSAAPLSVALALESGTSA